VTSIEGFNIWVLFDMVGKRKNEKQVVFVHSVQKSTMANNAPLKGSPW
jgi:hypothetical protein